MRKHSWNALFISVFCVFYVVHGVLKELKYELFAFIGAVTVVTMYCIINYAIQASSRNTIKLVSWYLSLFLVTRLASLIRHLSLPIVVPLLVFIYHSLLNSLLKIHLVVTRLSVHFQVHCSIRISNRTGISAIGLP